MGWLGVGWLKCFMLVTCWSKVSILHVQRGPGLGATCVNGLGRPGGSLSAPTPREHFANPVAAPGPKTANR